MPASPAGLLRAFHETFDVHRQDGPSPPPPGVVAMRQRLLEEEVAELAEAVQTGQLDKVAHELADVVYVAYGTALSYGIDLDDVLAEVHRANLSKLDDQGRPIRRADGKVLRSDRYRPPDVASVLRRQGWSPPPEPRP